MFAPRPIKIPIQSGCSISIIKGWTREGKYDEAENWAKQ